MASGGFRTAPVRTLLDALTSTFGTVASVALFLMMAHITLDVVMKYLLNLPIQGTLEIVSHYYMVAVVFLPLALVERHDGHISVEILSQLLPERVQELLIAAGSLLSAAYFGAFTYRTWGDAVAKLRIGEYAMGTVAVPIWPTRFMLPLGCGLITALLLYKAWRLALGDRSMLSKQAAQPDRGS